MPRRRVDHTTEHRLTLGEWERAALTETIRVQRENVRLDAFTATAQAVATAAAGVGGLLAGLALTAYAAPALWSALNDKTRQVLDGVADAILPSTPVEFRREAQRLAARRGEVNAAIDRFCTASSPDYSQTACSLAHDAKDTYFEELAAFRQHVHEANIEEDSFFWRFIFGGLGDIDPYASDPTRGSNQAWWRYFLNFEV